MPLTRPPDREPSRSDRAYPPHKQVETRHRVRSITSYQGVGNDLDLTRSYLACHHGAALRGGFARSCRLDRIRGREHTLAPTSSISAISATTRGITATWRRSRSRSRRSAQAETATPTTTEPRATATEASDLHSQRDRAADTIRVVSACGRAGRAGPPMPPPMRSRRSPPGEPPLAAEAAPAREVRSPS